MVRYKRYRRYGRYRRSTNVVRMKFQSFMDISTNDDSMQIITISAGGKEILRRLAPQFAAYKYYKIGNISVKLVPASTLPVDPTGLSYEAGENTVDPRDQLTPGMMRITNGEDIFENITGLSAEYQTSLYNTMMLDPRWFKWSLQSGVKRHATPRYWQVGQLHQDKWPGQYLNVPHYTVTDSGSSITGTDNVYTNSYSTVGGETSLSHTVNSGSVPDGFFQVGHRGVLGWLPTDNLHPSGQPFLASPPEIEVMKLILPRALKTRYYYRAYISETVLFREPIVTFGATDGTLEQPLDVFHYPSVPTPHSPASGVVWSFPGDINTGGNYGNH